MKVIVKYETHAMVSFSKKDPTDFDQNICIFGFLFLGKPSNQKGVQESGKIQQSDDSPPSNLNWKIFEM